MSATRVLVVDDNPSIRRFLSDALGFEEDLEVVAAVSDALEGIAHAGVSHPDVIVLDYQLPHLTGHEAIPHFRDVSPGSKILLYSAVFDLGQLPGDDVGADACLRKGVDPELIAETVRMLASEPRRSSLQ